MVPVFARDERARSRSPSRSRRLRRRRRRAARDARAASSTSARRTTDRHLIVARARSSACSPSAPGLVIVDEAYAEFAGTSVRARLRARTERCSSLRTFSKAFGLAGLRVGYAVGARRADRRAGESARSVQGERAGRARGARRARPTTWRGCSARVAEVRREPRAASPRRCARSGFAPLPSAANFVLVPVRGCAQGVAAALRERGIARAAVPRAAGIGDALRITIGRGAMERRCGSP